MKLKLQVVTPTRTVVDSEADEVELPGELGYLGILPGHTPLITVLKTGVLAYKNGTVDRVLAITAGFAEIANDVVTVLADQAEEELKVTGRETLDEVRSRLELAQARLEVARRK